MPDSIDAGAIAKWHPDPAPQSSPIEPRELPPVILDCLSELVWSAVDNKFVVPKVFTPEFSVDSFEDLRERTDLTGSAREALVATALLYADSLTKSDTSLLEAPFPVIGARFPGMYLQQNHLDRMDITAVWALKTLKRLSKDVSPSLLRRALEPLLASVTKKDNANWIAFGLLKLLAYSDKPSLAMNLIINVVLEMPEESSWQRILLHRGVLNGLPAGQAKALATGLRDGIVLRLDEQERRNTQHPYVPGEEQSPSLVKVSTVKMVA
jgi:hypothetical protein